MNVNQWVFWATAIPLAILIIVICLAWAGELDGLSRKFKDLWISKEMIQWEKDEGIRPPDPESYPARGMRRRDLERRGTGS